MTRTLTTLSLLAIALLPVAHARASNAAYVLLYHHVDESTPTSTSVTPDEFAVHMEYLAEAKYRVVSLESMLERLARGKKLRPRSVAITFDDAYPSVLSNALPVLAHRKWPFTVFVSTEAVDRGTDSYLSWDDLRALEKQRGTIANHSHSHGHLLDRSTDASADAWATRVRGDIAYAQERLEAELKDPARLFAYPYGELDAELMALVEDMGFLAVGQQSGPIGPTTHPQAAPRFPINSNQAGLASLAEKLNTRPFRITAPGAPATVLLPEDDKPTLELRLERDPFQADQLTCYVGSGTARVRWQNEATTFATVRTRYELPVGRSRYTCTAPHGSIPGVFYWYSHLLMRPPAAGGWYDG